MVTLYTTASGNEHAMCLCLRFLTDIQEGQVGREGEKEQMKGELYYSTQSQMDIEYVSWG